MFLGQQSKKTFDLQQQTKMPRDKSRPTQKTFGSVTRVLCFTGNGCVLFYVCLRVLFHSVCMQLEAVYVRLLKSTFATCELRSVWLSKHSLPVSLRGGTLA